MANPNLQLLTDAAKLLRPILGELVFVGGCGTALLITDRAAADVRATFDGGAIAEITSYAACAEFLERLRKLGYQIGALLTGTWDGPGARVSDKLRWLRF